MWIEIVTITLQSKTLNMEGHFLITILQFAFGILYNSRQNKLISITFIIEARSVI